ncbi:MAG: FAD-dependent oxidoreductase, partial [Bacteroidetes bacterium]|nr:FAD-dependent oxidoreductase [Bacteroidota bacterium]
TVFTNTGGRFNADHILLATDENSTPDPFRTPYARGQCVSNIYFLADNKPARGRMVFLNASANKTVNNIVVMNNISPNYAPDGKYLISVSLLSDHQKKSPDLLAKQVASELSKWFKGADGWRYLRTYHIPYALPIKDKYLDELPLSEFKLTERIFRCGDHLLNGSINAALKSGRLAAEAILST